MLRIPLFFGLCVSLTNSEMFTAQVELESLFDLRKSVADAVNKYIKQEEIRLQEVRNVLAQSSGLNRLDCIKGSTGKSDTANPINAFLTIKGLSMDLANILVPALDKSNIQELSDLMTSLNEEKPFPVNADLIGAVEGLARLQDTYKLSTKELSKGCLQDNLCTIQLTVEDCFELGRQNFKARNYNHSIAWMKEALEKLEHVEHLQNSTEPNTPSSIRLNKHLAISTNKINSNVRITKTEILDYIQWAEEILTTLSIGKQFLAELTGIELDSFIEEVVKVSQNQPDSDSDSDDTTDNYQNIVQTYEALCRGEYQNVSFINPELKCQYSTRGNNPFYIIGPIREELVSLDPKIWVFHNILYESEIKVIKELSTPMFKTAQVINIATGKSERSSVRVSKTAWLIDSDDPAIENVNRRAGLITGLSMETAEDLQIANYGLGGMYLTHHDFAYPPEIDSEEFARINDYLEGNRIATLMFYMSDVEAGGATVFPSANPRLTIWPEKGSAAFWYNLFPDGTGDYKTRHAACPVLVGSKWVSNKWIHDRGQEFRRVCDLQPN